MIEIIILCRPKYNFGKLSVQLVNHESSTMVTSG